MEAIDTEEPQLKPPLSLSPESIQSLYATSFRLYNSGKYEDAKNFFRILTLSDPHQRRFWTGLAACYKMLKSYSEAIECYSVAAIQDPTDPFVHAHAADCYHALGNCQQAIGALESAIEMAKSNTEHRALVSKLDLLHSVWSKQQEGKKP